MMMFASDLDRTLIYSLRAIEDLDGTLDVSGFKQVERRDGRWVSFMTHSSFEALREISNRYCFVPVTTRTSEQFRRITIFQEEILPRYAITSNGANILFNGILDKEWERGISLQLKENCVSSNELFFELSKEGFVFKGQQKNAENLFYYYILENRISSDEKKNLNAKVQTHGWRVSQQGKKLYFIPQCISKGAAIAYIQEREGFNTVHGAGDSLLDWDFLKNCSHRFVPSHGELAEENVYEQTVITKKRGIYAGEEILNEFLEQMEIHK